MDLPPDKAKVLKSYDDEKKWELVCDQVSVFKQFWYNIYFFFSYFKVLLWIQLVHILFCPYRLTLISGGDVTVCVWHINQLNLPTPFYSVLVSVSVFMALSTVFLAINSLDNSPFSDSVLLVLPLPCWSFQLSLYDESLLQPWYNPQWLTELKTLIN